MRPAWSEKQVPSSGATQRNLVVVGEGEEGRKEKDKKRGKERKKKNVY